MVCLRVRRVVMQPELVSRVIRALDEKDPLQCRQAVAALKGEFTGPSEAYAPLLTYCEPDQVEYDDNPWGADAQNDREEAIHVAAAAVLYCQNDPRGPRYLRAALLRGERTALGAIEALGDADILREAAEAVDPNAQIAWYALTNAERDEQADALRSDIQRALARLEPTPPH
jgi:hypothetical protein